MSPDRTRLAQRIIFRKSLARNLTWSVFALLAMTVALFILGGLTHVRTKNFLPSLHVGLTAAWVVAAVGAWLMAYNRIRVARHAVSAAATATISALDDENPLYAAWKDSVLRVVVSAAILGPLSLHAVVALFLCEPIADEFWGWAAMSVFLTTHVHVVGAVSVWRSARDVLEGQAPVLVFLRYGRTVAATTAAALVPGALLFGIPPLLVLITGAVLYGMIYAWLAYRIKGEAPWVGRPTGAV